MRLAFLTLLCSLFVSVVLAANLEDKSNIEDLTAAFDLIVDQKKFSEFDKVLTPDVTYNPGENPVQGIPATIDVLSKIIPSTTTTYFTLGTQLIKFLPPFDKYKRSNLAESVSYSTFVAFGSGNLTGEFFIIFAKFVDKEIVRTKQPGFGGWRFRNRKFEAVVSLPYQNTCATYHRASFPSPRPLPTFAHLCCSKESISSTLILTIFCRENLSETGPFWDYRRASNPSKSC